MMDRKMQRIVVAVIAVILIITMILTLVAPALAADDVGRTPKGVTIGAVDVSGMSLEEAETAVKEFAESMEESVLTVEAGGQEFTIPVKDLGFTWDNPDVAKDAARLGVSGNLISRYKVKKDIETGGHRLSIDRSYDAQSIRSFISDIGKSVYVAPVSCKLSFNGTTPYVSDGASGLRIDEDAAFSRLMVYLTSGWQEGDPYVSLTTEVLPPTGDKEELAKIRDNIGSGETDAVGSNDERMKNIRNAMRLISDTMLYPGESFSTLEKLVPFTAENGYELAHSYEEGAVVDTYGGGICQVSTTLYQAVMAAELAVDERVNHSMIVSYVEPSMDAAISEEGGKDFVFTNNTDAPIYIKGYVAGTVLHFDIYGLETRPENRKVVYRPEVLSKVSAPDNFTEDPEKPVGYIRLDQDPHEGVAAEVYKEVYVDNVLESNDWYNASEYSMSPARYTIGTAGADESLLTALRTAFETESLEMVYRVLAEHNITYKMTTAEAEAATARTASGEVNP